MAYHRLIHVACVQLYVDVLVYCSLALGREILSNLRRGHLRLLLLLRNETNSKVQLETGKVFTRTFTDVARQTRITKKELTSRTKHETTTTTNEQQLVI